MHRNSYHYKGLTLGIGALALVLAPGFLLGYSSGPNPFLTGNPQDAGGTTCNQAGCHVGTPLNQSPGRVQIVLPGAANYVPGQAQQISVTVSDSPQRGFGFQLTARVQSSNAQAGDLRSTDSSTFVQCSDFSTKVTSCPTAFPLQFIQHSSTRSGAGTATFTFTWTAPATSVGTVVFYAAGNAVNNNGASSGDRVYTTSLQVTPAAAANTPAISGVAPNQASTTTVTAGSWVSIYGTNLANTTYLLTDADRVNGAIPTALKGTSVTINGKPAFVYFVSPGQINVQAPDDTATGPVAVTVTSPAGTSSAGTVTLSRYAPVLFLFTTKYPVGVIPLSAVAYDLLGPPNTLGFTTRAARKGETILLFGTGFGPTTTSVAAGQPFDGANPTTTPVTVTVGGVPVTPDFAGLRYGGQYQFNIKIPTNIPSGDQPLTMSVGGVQIPSGLVITVQ